MTTTEPYLRIGELAQRTGTSPELLRAWERRYGLLSPGRSGGGFRLYSDADVERVRRMVSSLESGVAAAEAARLLLGETGGVEEPGPDVDAAALLEPLLELDDARANGVLDTLLAGYGVETVVRHAVLPALRELGSGWKRGSVSIAQEHFASNLLRARLLSLGRGWDLGVGPAAILAAVPGEHHDIPLVVLGLGLRNRGWRVTFLGADTPLGTLGDAAQRTEANVVVLGAVVPGWLTERAGTLAPLASPGRYVLAGPGAAPADAERIGADYVPGDPFEVAEELTRALRGTA